VTGDILLDVATQHVLDLFGLEATLDDQLLVAVHGTAGTQLGQQEVEQMLGQAMKRFRNVHEVGKGGLLGSHTQHLRRSHHELWLATGGHVRILVENDFEDPLQQLVVCVVAVGTKPGGTIILDCKRSETLDGLKTYFYDGS